MKIQQAVYDDLIEVLFLLRDCVNDMNKKGHKHLNNAYPGSELMIKAIEDKTLYLYKDRGIAKGMAILSEEEPNEYKNIEWKSNNEKVLFIRFLFVHPQWEVNGISERLIEFAEGFSKDHGYTSIRFDVFSGINVAENTYKNMGYTESGQFHSEFQTTPYLAYEKNI